MIAFTWDESFETRISAVDAQHRKLVDLVNKLGDMLANQTEVPAAELSELYADLFAYTNYHFDEEERMMEAEGLDVRHRRYQAQQHEGFRRYVSDLASSNPQPDQVILNYLVHWLTYHILGADQSLARQLQGIHEGLTPAAAFEREKARSDPALRPLLSSVGVLFESLSGRNRELVALNASLEKRVAERTAELSAANEELKALVATVERMAMTDSMTGLPNRRYAMTRLASAWATQARYQGRGLSCVLIDADGFKQVNDTCGHDAGDQVIKALAETLRTSARSCDEVCRLGGDEFLVLCPETPLEGGLQLAERLRAAVASLRVEVQGGVWNGSISVGVSAAQPAVTNFEELLRIADMGMYSAKAHGRNCVATVQSVPTGEVQRRLAPVP